MTRWWLLTWDRSARPVLIISPAPQTRSWRIPGRLWEVSELLPNGRNYGDLLEWAKLKQIVFKTGEFKDTGSPTRALTDNEKTYFQALIDDMYVQFIEAVANGRHLDIQAVRNLADGRVFTGRDAKERKLIDETGDFSGCRRPDGKTCRNHWKTIFNSGKPSAGYTLGRIDGRFNAHYAVRRRESEIGSAVSVFVEMTLL